jgi:predicted short-subunit dehydrogenase-like oxidoreductase (DUF2520 family)
VSADPRGRQRGVEPGAPAAIRPTVSIIGAGRAGTILARGLHRAGYPIAAVHSLSMASAAQLAAQVGATAVPTAVAAAVRAEITLLTVPDRAITRLAATVAATGVPLRGHALVHCSGAQSRGALAAARAGGAPVACCHPLMALARGADPGELEGSFFGIDADPTLVPVLERLVHDLGGIPFTAPSGDRALYHAAAVLAGNAPLALLARASELLSAAGVDAAVAGPALANLLEGAARNARRMGPQAALTGPVVRNDPATVKSHLEALRGDPQTQRLYHRLARETLRTAGATGREQVAELLSAPPRAARPGSARTSPTADSVVAGASGRLRRAAG